MDRDMTEIDGTARYGENSGFTGQKMNLNFSIGAVFFQISVEIVIILCRMKKAVHIHESDIARCDSVFHI